MNSKTLIALIIVISSFIIPSVSTYYVTDIYFTVTDNVYTSGERIELIGYLYRANYSSNGSTMTASTLIPNATINFTIISNSTYNVTSNYTLNTTAAGIFYSLSNYYPSGIQITAPATAGNYYLRAEYRDPDNSTSFSKIEIAVVNQTLDSLKVSPVKANYNPSESILVTSEAIRTISDKSIGVSNVSINGSLQNASRYVLQTFNCTTGSSGKCTTSVTAPTTYGNYILEVGNYKAFSSFYVVPFSFNLYMKDELGKSLKNIYAVGEQGRVEVGIANATSTDIYVFSGYIADSSGNVVKIINSTQLNSNNSFKDSFLFTVDSITFSYGTYGAYATVNKTGDGSISALTSFEVRDWSLAIGKKSSTSGFEYDYSTFPNKILRLEAIPTYRVNGTVIPALNSSFFTIALKDGLNNVVNSTNVSWNASCGGNNGCYEFSITSPSTSGQYNLYATLAHNGISQTKSQRISVISGVISGQPTDNNGAIKELFGTNEYVYISLSSYNTTVSQMNLSDAEIFTVKYMNGTEFSYINVSNFNLVNASNSAYEWAWNSTSQRIKLDIPKYGGLYSVSLFGNNRTLGAITKFIVNPYDYCITSKDTAGQVTSGYYYVSQFKKTDTIYFDIKIIQANNPLGKATASNNSGNSSGDGRGSACVSDTTKQTITNATITVNQVSNLESGAVMSLNASQTNCISSDNSGGYTCTLKPLTKWDGGTNIVTFNVVGQDGTISTAYSKFESRAFYLYGYASTWQNSPTSTISLNLQMYEAGGGWWGGGGSSGGLSGTISLKKIEYMGRDGEWIWPPISYNYTANQSSSITSGSGTLSLPASSTQTGTWKTGYYRAIIQGTTSSGDTDYGYAWFNVKLWDVYGQPIECNSNGCNYKNYFNSRENITLYIKISNAGSYNYNDMGGQSLGGNVSISVKKIQDCRSWPCKELNTSKYISNTIVVNKSSGWYWNSNSQNTSNYTIYINSTVGTWNTGYYSVTLDVNGTDTGYAWFNTIAFYTDTQPVNSTGAGYIYNIRGNKPMYFNVTTTKSYKSGYWYGSNYNRYNISDYINTTITDAVLRSWDTTTWRSKEFNYPEDINVTPDKVNGSGLVNMTYLNGSWPTGYYWGELTLNNSAGETGTGWLWFNVQPFRIQLTSNDYNIDSTQCINATLNIYEPDWNNVPWVSNYSIIEVFENTWNGMSQTKATYTNYTSTNLTNTTSTGNITFCPNSAGWGSGNWGGYHSLNVLMRDNVQNDTQTGWLSFRAVPFRTTWGSIAGGTNKQTNANIQIPVNVTTYTTGQNTSGNLTTIYQWRYDNYMSTKEEYVFNVGSCWSNVSGQCTVNGMQNVTIYPTSNGWKVGYNYLYTIWTKQNDASSKIEDWSGIYFDGREAYNGYFSSSDANGNYKYDFGPNENLTVKIYVRDSNYNAVNVNITNVYYAIQTNSCWSDWCRTYNTATWGLVSGGGGSGVETSGGNAIIRINAPSGGWTTKGYYYIKATISGGAGTGTILDSAGTLKVKDANAPNVTISSPANNDTFTGRNVSFSATTTENSQCYINIFNFNQFNSSYCGNATTSQSINACNITKYGYIGNSNYTIYISNNYISIWDSVNYTWFSGNTGMSTGGTTHTYVANTTSWSAQHYGAQVSCYDVDWNGKTEYVTFKVNNSV